MDHVEHNTLAAWATEVHALIARTHEAAQAMLAQRFDDYADQLTQRYRTFRRTCALDDDWRPPAPRPPSEPVTVRLF